MMFEPLVEVGQWLYSLVPTRFQWENLDFRKLFQPSFIHVHYLYMIGLSIVGSIIIFGSGFIPYIDALFLGAGATTQSGLNTMNINNLLLYQQIVLMLIACIANPIFINSTVVFVRLYWFEKRFDHVVREIREQRRSRAKTWNGRSRAKDEMSPEQLEMGVNGREIKVLHETTQPNGMSGTTAKTHETEKFKEKMGLQSNEGSVEATPDGSNKSSGETLAPVKEGIDTGAANSDAVPATPVLANHLGLNPTLHRQITFADEVKSSERTEEPHELARVREQPEFSKHIDFLERQQRNAKDGSVLRIPGPRASEMGEKPKYLDDSDDDELHRPQTRNSLAPIQSEQELQGMNTDGAEELHGDDHPERGGIRFHNQEHPGHRQNGDTMDRSTTSNSRFGLNRMRSGLKNHNPLRRRRSSSNRLHLNEARGSVGRTFSTLTTVLSDSKEKQNDPMPYLSWIATTGRNSAFVGLTAEQREELGGIEYRSLKTLAKVLVIYFVGFHLFGLIVNMPWILLEHHWKKVVEADGVRPVWWAIFTSASLFNDLGFTLTPDSMISFQQATLILIVGSFLIVIGNTGFPIMLRFTMWVASKFASHGSPLWEELRFLLDHPRRCFTLLFPSKATWWLFWILVLLNGVDLIFFIILDLNDKAVTKLPPGFRVLDGWFQATSTRTAGFACVNLALLHPAIQVSYMIMMYISVFPIAISVRRTNVYEEKSLGIFSGEDALGDDTDPSYVGQHLRRQLSFDLWYIFLGLFVICIVEGDRLSNTSESAFTMFSVLFEIVSAYGTVGLSLGYPGINASFSAEFRAISKLVIIAMMIRGRHRGLPYAVDRAILLPSEKLQRKEQEDADRRAVRRGSTFAEGHEAEEIRHSVPWGQNDMDENGLPRERFGPISSPRDAAMTAGAGGEQEPQRYVRRRTSGLSTASGRTGKHERSRSLGRVIAGGLSAGPTWSKHD